MTVSQLSQPRKRARQAGQKLERRQAILDAAWRAFHTTAYGELTVAAIARETGLAKGTVFLYFRTKEEIFLAVTGQQMTEWFDAVDDRLAQLPAPSPTEDVVEIIAGSLQERVYFTRLLAILSTVLEQNANYDALHQFKHLLLIRLARTGALLERALGFLQPGEGAHLLMQLEALVIGLRHLADAAPVVRQLMTLDEMRAFDVDFDAEFRQLALAMLRGMKGSPI
jgi:AcrR family transcriptional regulator